MRRAASLVALLCALLNLASCSVWREKRVVNHWSDVTGGESLERSLWRDIQAQDWKELERHIAGNYVATTSAGKMDRTAVLARVQQLKVDDYALSDFQVELNANTLVVVYTTTLRGTFAGEALPPVPLRIMGVWQHQKSGWIAIAHSIQS
jgi:hypothetical protein